MILSRPLTNYLPMMKMIQSGRAMVVWQQEVLPEDKSSNIWPGLLLQVQANRDALSNLQTALDVPVLYFNLDYSQGWTLLLPHLAKLKQAEILAAAFATTALYERKFSEAWTNLHTSVVLVRRYQTEPLLISHLVRVAMAQIAVSATWEFLQSDQLTDAQLAELQSDWQEVEYLFDSSEACFVMERAMNIEVLQLARKSYDELSNLGLGSAAGSNFFGGLANDPGKALHDLYERYPRYWAWKRSWSYDEELFSLQSCEATLKAIHRTELIGAFAPAVKELDVAIDQFKKLHTNSVSHFMFGSQDSWRSNAVLKFANAENARRLLVAAIALKRYQLRHGKYPADLNALVPEFLRQVPVDLTRTFNFLARYHPKPDGTFLLYSVGEDGEDNGGDPTPTEPATTKSKVWYRARDAVWPQPATSEQVAAYYKNLTAPTATNPTPIKGGIKETNAPAGTNVTGR